MKIEGRDYLCSAGETFDSVALVVYGDEIYASELLNANPALCEKLVFDGGERLSLPMIELPDADSPEAYAPANAPWK